MMQVRRLPFRGAGARETHIQGMEPRLFRYIWQHTRRDQILILLVILASLPFYFLSLDLPKVIVNGPINGKGFIENGVVVPGATARFLELNFSLPGFLGGGKYTLFSGFELERLSYLVALSMMFLALVCVNGVFKLYINTTKGGSASACCAASASTSSTASCAFRPRQFRGSRRPKSPPWSRTRSSRSAASSAMPSCSRCLLGGQALTAMVFIMVQNFWLGMIAVGIVAVQAFIIPQLRRRLLGSAANGS